MSISPELKEKLLSRQFAAWWTFFAVTTSILVYMVGFRCHELNVEHKQFYHTVFNHEAALNYMDAWMEGNLWSALVFGVADNAGKVIQKIGTFRKKTVTATSTETTPAP